MKMNARAILRIVAVVVLVAVLGWQFFGHRGKHATRSDASASTSAVASVPAKPVKPAPPATLQLGKLTVTACELHRPGSAATVAAFCADFPVPENRAEPASRTLKLKLAIIKSSSQVPAKDLVVYLAGGPGQSAIQTYPEMAPAFAPLLKHHNLLLLDQRGTGGSHPLLCPTVDKQMRQLEDASPTPAERAALVGACASEVEKTADPRYYATLDAVADLEAVRQALGAPKLDLVGVSYGTRMAQHFASAHPDAVRSIVLDGVVPNTLVLGDGFGWALQRALKLQAAACSATPACEQAFGDWYATLQQLHAKLQAGTPPAVTFNDPIDFKPVTQPMTADRLAGVVRMFSYSATTSALLPLAVHEAAHGDYAPLMAQSRLITDSVGESMQGGMQLSVTCTEDAPLLTADPRDDGTLLGHALSDAMQAECRQWPHGPMPAGFHAPFKSSIPTLLISGERDPVTPPSYADEVLKGLSNGRALVVKGRGHAEPINAGCMPALVDQFIGKLQPQQLDAQCLDKLGPIPAFTSFNGAAP